ncbi:hypothetical protein CDAR_268601 [Caerostris darwini]|uniref:Uncharacterized protein n=1 Tax=Caerostris darwini TaxID=1538125 RepID=A0AAV4X5J5_9ARAC|nr:hypothetical protein CDAR_268601 [Caerostris darwini]
MFSLSNCRGPILNNFLIRSESLNSEAITLQPKPLLFHPFIIAPLAFSSLVLVKLYSLPEFSNSSGGGGRSAKALELLTASPRQIKIAGPSITNSCFRWENTTTQALPK